MKPFVARVEHGTENLLVLDFIVINENPMAVCVADGGQLMLLPLRSLIVEWGTVDWPFGEGEWVRPKEDE